MNTRFLKGNYNEIVEEQIEVIPGAKWNRSESLIDSLHEGNYHYWTLVDETGLTESILSYYDSSVKIFDKYLVGLRDSNVETSTGFDIASGEEREHQVEYLKSITIVLLSLVKNSIKVVLVAKILDVDTVNSIKCKVIYLHDPIYGSPKVSFDSESEIDLESLESSDKFNLIFSKNNIVWEEAKKLVNSRLDDLPDPMSSISWSRKIDFSMNLGDIAVGVNEFIKQFE